MQVQTGPGPQAPRAPSAAGGEVPGPQVPHPTDNCPQGCHLRRPPPVPVEPLRGDCHPPASRPCAKSRCARACPWWSVGSIREGQGSTRPRGPSKWPQRELALEKHCSWSCHRTGWGLGLSRQSPGCAGQEGPVGGVATPCWCQGRAAEMHDHCTGEEVTAGSQAVARPGAAWRRGGEHSPEGRGSEQGL